MSNYDYDDFSFDGYRSSVECPMGCGSLVHDGICYECGADVDAVWSAISLDPYTSTDTDYYSKQRRTNQDSTSPLGDPE